MITIPLTQGQVALLDDEDAHLARYRWFAEKRERTFYATRNVSRVGKGKRAIVRLHTAVLGRPLPFFEIDHINGNGLDCRRSNLRLVYHVDNQRNRRTPSKRASTPFKGVSLASRGGRWRAYIGAGGGRSQHLGQFSTAEEAARAYDAAAIRLFGSHARLNFPDAHAA